MHPQMGSKRLWVPALEKGWSRHCREMRLQRQAEAG